MHNELKRAHLRKRKTKMNGESVKLDVSLIENERKVRTGAGFDQNFRFCYK